MDLCNILYTRYQGRLAARWSYIHIVSMFSKKVHGNPYAPGRVQSSEDPALRSAAASSTFASSKSPDRFPAPDTIPSTHIACACSLPEAYKLGPWPLDTAGQLRRKSHVTLLRHMREAHGTEEAIAVASSSGQTDSHLSPQHLSCRFPRHASPLE
jgi:hypothetical protein